MKEIVHLTSVHIADDTRIYQKMCLSLSREGWLVTLIARKPQNPLSKEITYIPFPEYGGKFRRMILAPVVMLVYALKTGKKCFQIHDPELIITGLFLKIFRKKVVLDVHENYADQIMEKDYAGKLQKSILATYVRTLEKLAALLFDQIFTVVPGIKKLYPEKKCLMVQNFAIKDELTISDESAPSFRERENLVYYVGSITKVRGIGEVIDAMALIPGHYKAKLILAGSFGEPFLQEEYQKKPGWEKVEYLGFQSRDAIRETFSRVKAGVITLHPVKQYIGAQSIKMFEYMSAGLPVIVTDIPMMNEIIKKKEAGLIVEPFDVEMLAQAMITLFDNPDIAKKMGDAGRQAIQEEYNWESQFVIYREALEKLYL